MSIGLKSVLTQNANIQRVLEALQNFKILEAFLLRRILRAVLKLIILIADIFPKCSKLIEGL